MGLTARFCLQESVDLDELSLSLNIQFISILRLQVIHDFVCFIAP